MALGEKNKKIFGAVFLITLFIIWVIILYKIPSTEIVDFVGIQNSYALVFVLAIIGGTSILFPFPYYLVVFTFAAGGSNPFLLAFMAGTGVAIGDSTSYLFGYSGREIFNGRFMVIFNKLYNWLSKKPKWMLFSFLYLYAAISPLPNDLINVPMGFMRFPYSKLMIPMWLGNITFDLIIALSGMYGFHLFFIK